MTTSRHGEWLYFVSGNKGVGETKYSTRGPWPQRAQHLPLLFDMSYDAEFVLWNPIARRSDRKGELPRERMSEELRGLRYSDGTPVLRDHQLNGAPLMRDILLELGKLDDVASNEMAYKDWSEDNQRSPKNNRYIYQAIMDVLRRDSPPVGRFKASTPPR